MNDATPLPFALPAVARKKLTGDFDGGSQSSDGGLLALRAAECRIRRSRTVNPIEAGQRLPSTVSTGHAAPSVSSLPRLAVLFFGSRMLSPARFKRKRCPAPTFRVVAGGDLMPSHERTI